MIKYDEEGIQIKGSTAEVINEFLEICNALPRLEGFFFAMPLIASAGVENTDFPEKLPFIRDIAWAFVKNRDLFTEEVKSDDNW